MWRSLAAWFWSYASGQTERQTNKQADILITILCTPQKRKQRTVVCQRSLTATKTRMENAAFQYIVVRFLADRTIGRAFGTLCRLSVCRLSVVYRLSVTFCIAAKR